MLMIAAPPTPCSTRIATSIGSVCDSAQPSEPRAKTATPAWYIGR